MKSRDRAGVSRPEIVCVLAIFIVSILVVNALSISLSFSASACAVQKTETVTGDISLVLDKAVTPTKQVTGTPRGSSSTTTQEADAQGVNRNKTAEPSAISKVLAATGDYLPYILIALAMSSACAAVIVYIM